MKKIFNYIMVCAVAVTVLSACRPMDKTYDELGGVPAAVKTVTPPTIASLTLTADDYAKLPASNAASSQFFFHGTTDAFASIPAILTKTYPTAANNSQINVTYATSPAVPPAVVLADDVNANVSISLQTTPTNDYTYAAFTYTPAVGSPINIAANNNSNLNTANAINWLRNKYKVLLPNNSIRVLTYLYFESNVTPSTGTSTTDAFLYTTAGDWQKIYRVNNAQYVSVNRGTNFGFLVADLPNLPSYFNTFLKSDPTVMLTAKIGDIQYVNYKVYVSASVSYQDVLPLAFDGSNWITATTATTLTNLFTYNNGVWTGQLDNTVFYTLTAADYAKIIASPPTTASTAAVANLTTNKNFQLNGLTTRWTDDQIVSAIIPILQSTYTSPAVNQKFVVTFSTYSQYKTETATFVFDGTAFVYLPAPDNAKYQLTGDDYDVISKLTTTGATSGAMTNLQSFGDFSLSGATAWTDAQINIGIATVLKTRYTAATTNQTVLVTYIGYNSGNRTLTRIFKYDGTNWTAQ